jgi:2-methylcitrate dehydratase
MGVAVGSAILLRLPEDAVRQCISLVAVSGNALLRSRRGAASAWKSAASGHAGRAGVFAALLADRGIGAPTMPFAGAEGWLDVVARGPVELALPKASESRRLLGTIIKPRAACGAAIPAVLAAESAHQQGIALSDVAEVVVETYRDAFRKNAVGAHHWAPTTRETADHSIPYVVAAALMDGTVGPAQYDDSHLRSPVMAQLLAKVRVEESAEFTAAYDAAPVVHRTRVTVANADGATVQGESGGSFGDISDPMANAQIKEKFAAVVVPALGKDISDRIVERVWVLDAADEIAPLTGLLAEMESADDQL